MMAGLGCMEWGWPLSAEQSRGKLEQSLQLLAESVVAKGGDGWVDGCTVFFKFRAGKLT